MISKILRYFLFMSCLITITSSSGTNIYAASTGKIAGKIIDTETKEALVGANILVEGQSIGAATDFNGDYFILNVPPGTYSLKVTMIGYESKIITDVRVNIDKTTQINVTLKSTAIQGEAVVVRAERKIINLDVSSTTTNLSSKDIEAKPVTTMTQLLAMQPGVSIGHSAQNGTGVSIRGGGIEETDFQMNGVSLKDQMTSSSFMSLPMTSIKEIQVLTGGFSAEYGGIRSGLINVVSKDGSETEYSSDIDVKYSPPALKHFGPNAFDQNGLIWKVFAGEKAFTGTTATDVTEFENSGGKTGYPFEFKGWNAISKALLEDGNPNNDLTPQKALELWKYQHRVIDYGNKPDYNIDATFSGPVPFTLFDKKISFLAAVKFDNSQYAYPLSRKAEENEMFVGKITTRLSNALKLSIDNIYGIKKGSSIGSSDDVGVVPGGFWGPNAATASGSYETSGYVAQEFPYTEMYNEGNTSLRDDYLYRLNVEFTYVFTPSTFATLRYQYGRDWVSEGHMRNRSGAGVYQIGDTWYDETPRGWSSSLGTMDLTNTFYLQGGGERYNYSWNLFHAVEFDITSQLNKFNEIKAGGGVNYSSLHSRSAVFWLPTYYTYEQTPWVYQYWDEHPTTGYLYLLDKLEFEGFIANVGLRAEYLDPNSNSYKLTSAYDDYYTTDKFSVGNATDLWFYSRKTEETKAKVKLQPRVGISYPVSEVGKIYFNYGHFYQPPDYYRMYSPGVTGGGSPGFLIPNPNLDWPRTIQYEVGYEHQIANLFLVRAAGYYKDITGQFMLMQGINWDETVNNQIWTNNSYADIRGIELSFNKPNGDWVTFWSNLNYEVGTSGVTSIDVLYENPIKAEEQKYYVQKIEPTPAINVSAGITFSSPNKTGLTVLGFDPLANINVSFIYSYDDGGKMLFNPESPTDQQHYLDNVDYTNTNLRIDKNFSIGSNQFVVYMDVFNLFNEKYLNMSGWTNAEIQNYKNSLKVPWKTGDQNGNDKWGDYPHDGKQTNIKIGWRSWMQFLNPRDIFFGIKYKF